MLPWWPLCPGQGPSAYHPTQTDGYPLVLLGMGQKPRHQKVPSLPLWKASGTHCVFGISTPQGHGPSWWGGLTTHRRTTSAREEKQDVAWLSHAGRGLPQQAKTFFGVNWLWIAEYMFLRQVRFIRQTEIGTGHRLQPWQPTDRSLDKAALCLRGAEPQMLPWEAAAPPASGHFYLEMPPTLKGSPLLPSCPSDRDNWQSETWPQSARAAARLAGAVRQPPPLMDFPC